MSAGIWPHMALTMLAGPGPNCLISGGEPVVKLVPADRRGKGGRNQQLVLAALEVLSRARAARRRVILSGGTDGEDGPTDAAGAWIDAEVLARAAAGGLDPHDSSRATTPTHFFEPLGALDQDRPDPHERLRRASGAGRAMNAAGLVSVARGGSSITIVGPI